MKILCLAASLFSVAANAQSASEPTSAATDAVSTLTSQAGVAYSCMGRRAINVDGRAANFTVPVPTSGKDEIAAHGFTPAACAGSATDLVRFKQEMCDFAKGNQAVQLQMEKVLGVSGVKLCSIARTLVPDSADTASK